MLKKLKKRLPLLIFVLLLPILEIITSQFVNFGPVSATDILPPVTIESTDAYKIADAYLHYYKTHGYHNRLIAYGVHHAENTYEDTEKTVISMLFSVRPLFAYNSAWIVGDGTLVRHGWIRDKTLFLTLTRNEEGYTFSDVNIQEDPSNKIFHTNTICGYQLIFPKYWKDYYYIDDSNPQEIIVYFCGKSNTGSILWEKQSGMRGLELFKIIAASALSEKAPSDSVKRIGIIQDVSYYCTINDTALAPLSAPAEYGKQFADGRYTVDDAELSHAAQDLEIAQRMQDSIEKVLRSFAPYEPVTMHT